MRSPRDFAQLRRGLIGTTLVIAGLELLIRASGMSESVLPPVSAVLAAMLKLLGDRGFLDAMTTTTSATLLSLGICVAVGVPLGAILGFFPASGRVVMPMLELIRPMPPVALIPLVIVTLGLGLALQTTMGVVAGLWPILFNAAYGVAGVDRLARDTATSFGITGWRQLVKVCLPGAGPLIWVGVRLAASSILIVIVATELLAGARGGIGAFILEASATTRVTEAFAATAYAGLIGLIVNGLLGLVATKWFAWQQR